MGKQGKPMENKEENRKMKETQWKNEENERKIPQTEKQQKSCKKQKIPKKIRTPGSPKEEQSKKLFQTKINKNPSFQSTIWLFKNFTGSGVFLDLRLLQPGTGQGQWWSGLSRHETLGWRTGAAQAAKPGQRKSEHHTICQGLGIGTCFETEIFKKLIPKRNAISWSLATRPYIVIFWLNCLVRQVFILDDNLKPMADSSEEITGLLGVAGPQVTPGYVERGSDGRALIGAGPLSQDMFKVDIGSRILMDWENKGSLRCICFWPQNRKKLFSFFLIFKGSLSALPC